MAATAPSPSPSTGAERKAARRIRIVEAAMKLAAEGGYEAVQMRAVAERADVSLGTIYRYFKSKDDLLLAGLSGWVHLLRRQLQSEPGEGDSPGDRLAGVLGRAARAAEGAPILMSALVTALSTTDPGASSYKVQVDSEVQAMMVTALGDTDIDAEGVARVVGHVWLSAISRWVGGLAPAGSVEAELRHAVSMLVD
ncbi:MAG: TetR family transcriptional regulator [Acidimicrobiales bacterium]|nr:MAG: TetR family transcriptional regulator [Acidimicrobiales bacterium]